MFKFGIILSGIVSSVVASAQHSNIGHPVEVPYPAQVSLYYGNVKAQGVKLKAELLAKASKVCGGIQNVAVIGNVETKFRFEAIDLSTPEMEGGYPIQAATATVYCR